MRKDVLIQCVKVKLHVQFLNRFVCLKCWCTNNQVRSVKLGNVSRDVKHLVE